MDVDVYILVVVWFFQFTFACRQCASERYTTMRVQSMQYEANLYIYLINRELIVICVYDEDSGELLRGIYIYSRLFKFLEFYAVIQNGGGRARLINRSIELDGSEK